MSLLREIITDLNESAAGGATGGGAVGAYHGSLFGGGEVGSKMMKRHLKSVQRIPLDTMQKTIKNRNTMKWRVIGEMVNDGAFDPADVMSKLDAAEKQAKVDTDTIPFGMEDEDGNIVKVYVRAEQADEFETALASLLAGEDEDEDGISDSVEIAEVLFQLKDKFEIVDVEWPEIEGDVEEEQELEGDEGEDLFGDEGGDEMDLEGGEEGDLEGGDEEFDLEGGDEDMDLEGDLEMEPEGGAESALNQVIDMMKADAEARKAESEARAKEAEARTAEANANASASKVKQEEQVLDMEAYDTQKKEEEEEAKRLAKLAKFQHDKASDYEAKMSQEEEEAEAEVEDYRASNQDRGRTDREVDINRLGNDIAELLIRGVQGRQ